jgi:dTDP-glucose 4,6-dehydratase
MHWLIDCAAWVLAVAATLILRFDFHPERVNWLSAAGVTGVLLVGQLLAGLAWHLYQSRYLMGSFEQTVAVGGSVAVLMILGGVAMIAVASVMNLPRSLVLMAGAYALLAMLLWRYALRLVRDAKRGPAAETTPALVYGAGYVGAVTVRRMTTDSKSPYTPVGLIDDDPAKRNLRIQSVPVRGSLEDLPRVVRETGATTLIIAISDVDSALMNKVLVRGESVGLAVKIVPTLDKDFFGEAMVGEARPVTVEDFIGRHPVDLDIASIASYLTGKRVLVTGGGGSIGQELCRQVLRHAPEALVVVDHDETHLQDTEFALYGTGLLMRSDMVLADIRDLDTMRNIFLQWRPDVVFHAAALKHVPTLQRFPHEAWETNVLGTLNVLLAARDVGVGRFINISTDKAADPTTILGHSKRAAERLTAWMDTQADGHYCSVRFGNVFGSRGSMAPLFQKMIDAGRPIELTDKEATRFFMTIPEACQLVVQAGYFGTEGDVFILDMGRPVRIADIAERMVEASGKSIIIRITGLREGEKLHEELMSAEEMGETSQPHAKIAQAHVPPLAPDNLDYDAWVEQVRVRALVGAAARVPARVAV